MRRGERAPVVLLVAPDDPSEAKVMEALRQRGLQPSRVSTGAEASERLRGGETGLIVVRDPLPDGESIPWIAAQREAGCRLPIVFRSNEATSLASFTRLTRELRVSLVLREPVVPMIFADQVGSLLQAPPLRGAQELSKGLQEELAKLRRGFARSLPARLGELSRAAQLARDQPSDMERVHVIESQAHSLKGVAGTLGFEEISAAAGRIQDVARRWLEAGSPDPGPALGQIEEELVAAHATLDTPKP
jgi:HPt (histidine-containing phosphotransfer) domain-containing protein